MSEELETTEEIRAGYAFNRYSIETAYEEFDRWYAEEIRKAKEEAWTQGRLDERHDCRVTTEHLELPPEERDAFELERNLRLANPYRKEENE